MARNADKLRANIEKCEHATTEALFAESPGLCDYIWEDWEGLMSLRTMVDNLLLHYVVCHSTRHALYCVVCPPVLVMYCIICLSTCHVLHCMPRYLSDRHKAILSRNRDWTQTNSNARGLTEDLRFQIRWKKRRWELICPKLDVTATAPVFPKGIHRLW